MCCIFSPLLLSLRDSDITDKQKRTPGKGSFVWLCGCVLLLLRQCCRRRFFLFRFLLRKGFIFERVIIWCEMRTFIFASVWYIWHEIGLGFESDYVRVDGFIVFGVSNIRGRNEIEGWHAVLVNGGAQHVVGQAVRAREGILRGFVFRGICASGCGLAVKSSKPICTTLRYAFSTRLTTAAIPRPALVDRGTDDSSLARAKTTIYTEKKTSVHSILVQTSSTPLLQRGD